VLVGHRYKPPVRKAACCRKEEPACCEAAGRTRESMSTPAFCALGRNRFLIALRKLHPTSKVRYNLLT
jgi:hypothetical protein